MSDIEANKKADSGNSEATVPEKAAMATAAIQEKGATCVNPVQAETPTAPEVPAVDT